MTWTPRYHHVSQLYDAGDGSGLNGHNDCAMASLLRYLREAAYPFSGAAATDDHAAIVYLRQQITGAPWQEYNPDTYTGQITTYLDGLGFDGSWTQDVTQYNHPGTAAFLLLAAADLQPAQYPFDWLGTWQIDHYILRLPNGQYNDPLAYQNGQADCSYSDAAVLAALRAAPGGWVNVLPDPHTVTWQGGLAVVGQPAPDPAPAPAPGVQIAYSDALKGARYTVLKNMMARKRPRSDSAPGNVFFLKNGRPQTVYRGAVLQCTGHYTGHWRQVTAGPNAVWLPLVNLRAA